MSDVAKQERSFVLCPSCGHEEFRAGASAVEILRFPKDDPSEFDCVTGKSHSIDYIQCDECGKELDLDAIGFYG